MTELTATTTTRLPFGGGLRQEWIAGEDPDPNSPIKDFSLQSGAGLGNRYLTLHVNFTDGSTTTESLDVAALAEQWVTKVVEARG